MEASVAANAGGEGAAETAEAQAPAVDFSPVLQQIEQVGGRLGQVEQLIQQFAAPEGEGEEDDATLQALAEFYGAAGQEELAQPQAPEFNPEAASKFLSTLQGTFDSKVQEAIQPLMQEVTALRAGRDAEQLYTKYPEMKNPEVAKAAVDGAMQLAQAMGYPAESGRNAAAVEAFYKAMRYDQIAAGEVPVDELQHPTLEPGGGASPRGGLGATGGTARDIVAARGGNSFWGT
jgi:hypothetical protein